MSSSIKVITRISGAHPELLADLKSLDPRERAERLRSLASTALRVGGAAGVSAAHVVATPSPTVEKSQQLGRRLISSLEAD